MHIFNAFGLIVRSPSSSGLWKEVEMWKFHTETEERRVEFVVYLWFDAANHWQWVWISDVFGQVSYIDGHNLDLNNMYSLPVNPFNDCNRNPKRWRQKFDFISLFNTREIVYTPPPPPPAYYMFQHLYFKFHLLDCWECFFLKERKRKRSKQSIYVYDKHP